MAHKTKLFAAPFMVPASEDRSKHYTLLFVNVATLDDLNFVKQELSKYIKSTLTATDDKFYINYDRTEPWGRNSTKLIGEAIVQFHEKLFAHMKSCLEARASAGTVKLGDYRLPHVDVRGQFDTKLLQKLDAFDWMDLDRLEQKLKKA